MTEHDHRDLGEPTGKTMPELPELPPEPETTGLPKADRAAPHVTGRKRQLKPPTLADRLADSRKRAKALGRNTQRKINLRFSVSLVAWEKLIELAEKHDSTVNAVARRCLMDGLTRYVRLPAHESKNPFDEDTFGVFDRHPKLDRAAREYGEDEAGFRREMADEIQQARDRAAKDLGLTGRRAVGA